MIAANQHHRYKSHNRAKLLEQKRVTLEKLISKYGNY